MDGKDSKFPAAEHRVMSGVDAHRTAEDTDAKDNGLQTTKDQVVSGEAANGVIEMNRDVSVDDVNREPIFDDPPKYTVEDEDAKDDGFPAAQDGATPGEDAHRSAGKDTDGKDNVLPVAQDRAVSGESANGLDG